MIDDFFSKITDETFNEIKDNQEWFFKEQIKNNIWFLTKEEIYENNLLIDSLQSNVWKNWEVLNLFLFFDTIDKEFKLFFVLFIPFGEKLVIDVKELKGIIDEFWVNFISTFKRKFYNYENINRDKNRDRDKIYNKIVDEQYKKIEMINLVFWIFDWDESWKIIINDEKIPKIKNIVKENEISKIDLFSKYFIFDFITLKGYKENKNNIKDFIDKKIWNLEFEENFSFSKYLINNKKILSKVKKEIKKYDEYLK